MSEQQGHPPGMNGVTDKAMDTLQGMATKQPIIIGLLLAMVAILGIDAYYDHARFEARADSLMPLLEACVGVKEDAGN